MVPLNWIASPILAQRNIEVHSIDTAFDEVKVATVYTVTDATGKIGVFSIPTMTLAKAVADGDAVHKALLERHFAEMEFSDGQPAIPEIQPEPAGPETDSGQPEEDSNPVNDDGATEPGSVDAGDPPSTPEATGEESDAGPAVEPVSERRPKERRKRTQRSKGGSQGDSGPADDSEQPVDSPS